MTSLHEDEVEQATLALARQLGREAIDLAWGERTITGYKRDAFDVVTAPDVAIERHLRWRIGELFPTHAVLGEEQGLGGERGCCWTWVLDPIDGTFNYATGFPGAGSSIALMKAGRTRVGAIADFALNTVFACRRGSGVTWDGSAVPLDLGPATALGRARLLIDPGHQAPHPELFRAIQWFAERVVVVPRMIGSAAVSLAAVALTGGSFVGAGLEIWDAVAGTLLAEERGLTVHWWRLARDSSHHVLAGEPELVETFEPGMPNFIRAWHCQRADSPAGVSADDLLGPSATILVGHEDE